MIKLILSLLFLGLVLIACKSNNQTVSLREPVIKNSSDSIVKLSSFQDTCAPCNCIPDSLTINPSSKTPIHPLIVNKSDKEIFNSISALMKKLDEKKYKELIGEKLAYYIDVDKTGKIKVIKCYMDYLNVEFFDKAILNYLSSLKFRPAYIFKHGQKRFVNSSKYLDIEIK